jgi:transcriptional regulator with XRE-family HTH domain
MAPISRSFGSSIRERRLQLHLTREQLARLVKSSASYISNLEADRRRPSEKLVTKLAEALELDSRELLLFTIPGLTSFLSEPETSQKKSAWKTFLNNEELHKAYNITDRELEMLSKVAMMGEVRSSEEFIFILKSIRQAARKWGN